MTNRNMAIVGYITIIGWAIAYFSYRNGKEKSSFVRYHLNQSLGIVLLSVALSFISAILLSIVPSLATLLYLVSLIPFVFMLLGIITAANETQRPVPVIGKWVEGKFNL
ncbi:hypothetical protein GCM10023231_13310 [Olivibacter ginsenosidimutans]|uniref:DUF4870 domain-containing protein n=1 Tax=Olivibacter ginsenosidimutans TaxID=1176537 RepID=A0ABP9AXW1_9SPHI